MLDCNNEEGVCIIDKVNLSNKIKTISDELTVMYIGDPMCSRCWGISPILKKVQNFCTDHKIKFNLMLGGLRIGGGDLWNDEFKNFLKNEWMRINERTGQKFVFNLLEKEDFNYDTEPACRAVFISKILLNSQNDNNKTSLEFFSAIQKKFYACGEDSTEINFYKSICEEFNISFETFSFYFNSNEIKNDLIQEICDSKQLMVRGMPSLMLFKNGLKLDISSGYKSYESIITNIKKYIMLRRIHLATQMHKHLVS